MKEAEVRGVLRQSLLAQHADDPGTLVLDELGVHHGEVRVDVAVVNARLHAFEIKSPSDTLERLPTQAEAYNTVFDRVTLVVANRHRERALPLIPHWWGVLVVDDDGELHALREPADNPDQDPRSIAGLLWRDEVLAVLEELGQARGVRSKPRRMLYERLAAACDLETLKHYVRKQLKARAEWRSDALRT